MRSYSKLGDRRPGNLFLQSVRTSSTLQGDLTSILRAQIQQTTILLNQVYAGTRAILDASVHGRTK